MSFGIDLDMLLLHMRTLSDVADGFIVAESNSTFTRAPKYALLTAALQAGHKALPASVASKVHVVVVDLVAAATHGVCSQHSPGRARTACSERWQRYNVLPLLFQLATADDIAVYADSDEISKPSVLELVKACYPFPEESDGLSDTDGFKENVAIGKLTLAADHFQFGLHCRMKSDNPWRHGPSAYSVRMLMRVFGGSRIHPLHSGPLPDDSMFVQWSDARGWTHFGVPVLLGGGWHLSSFGTPSLIRLKFASWGHSDMFHNGSHNLKLNAAQGEQEGGKDWQNQFAARPETIEHARRFARNGYEHDALSEQRISRCAAFCLDPYPQPRFPKYGTKQTVPPCVGAAHAGDTALGKRKDHPPAGLPMAFSEPYFAELLFGYMKFNSSHSGRGQQFVL